jgi:predicted phage terminase large subunit-like protein
MKSILCSIVWPAWEWTFKPSTRWLYSSYAQSLSNDHSTKCRRLITSEWYQRNFGHVFRLTGDQNEKVRFDNNKTGCRLATSVEGSNTGAGGDRIVIDDPHNANEAESDTVREGVIDWFDGVMSTRLNDPIESTVTIIMQRVHEKDLSGHIIKTGDYHHLCLPAEYDPKQTVDYGSCKLKHDPRTEPDELLWPSRVPREELERLKRTLGSYRAAGQLQQRPSPREGGTFQRGWWKYYGVSPQQCAATCDRIIHSWDMTFKDAEAAKKNPDYVVGQCWGQRGAEFFLLDEIRDRMDFTASQQAVINFANKWPQARLKLIEDKANGPAIISSLRRKVSGLTAVEPSGSKAARASAVSPLVEAGNIYLPGDAPWIHDWIEEWSNFRGVDGQTDDRVDAGSQALIRLSEGPKEPGLEVWSF